MPEGREGFYGGAVSLSDYCPYIQEFTWRSQNVVIRGSHCQYAENNPREKILTIIYIYDIFRLLIKNDLF